MKRKERESKDVQNMLQKHAESSEQLNMTLKVWWKFAWKYRSAYCEGGFYSVEYLLPIISRAFVSFRLWSVWFIPFFVFAMLCKCPSWSVLGSSSNCNPNCSKESRWKRSWAASSSRKENSTLSTYTIKSLHTTAVWSRIERVNVRGRREEWDTQCVLYYIVRI